MAKVSNLKIKVQGTTAGTYYASWDFTETTQSASSSSSSSSSSSTVRVGDWVTIKSGATWYNGVAISSWVFGERWKVIQVSGNRAVLGKNASGTKNVQSAINTKYLIGGSGSGSNSSSGGSTSTTTDLTKYLDHYEVRWYYDTGNNIWFEGSRTTVERKSATYNPPSNAIAIKVAVKPVSKTKTVNNKETSYFTGTFAYAEYKLSGDPPDGLSTPNVVIDKFSLTATVDNIADSKIDKVQFQVYDGDKLYNSGTVEVVTRRAVYSCKIAAGGNYRVRCRSINSSGTSNIYGEWSDFSGENSTIPKSVGNITCVADSTSSVRVSWKAISGATGYEVEYAINKSYFDSSSEVSYTRVSSNTAYITGLEAREWFFRVRAINNNGESGWSSVGSVVIGTKPQPPTTWSSTTTAIIGESVVLYWVHNTEDGSKQVKAQIELTVNGDTSTVTVSGVKEDEDEGIYSYTIDTDDYSQGTTILWKIRTQGVTEEYGDWSTQRTISVYAPPTLSLNISADENLVLKTLPLVLNSTAGPDEQTPISYYVSVVAKTTYETDNAIGSTIFVPAGTEVYSKIFNVSEHDFELSLSAGDFILENGQTYVVKVLVSMNSGLTAESEVEFTTNWDDYTFFPDARVSIDNDTYSAYISPFCVNETGAMASDVTLAVYRREYDGSFTEIAAGLTNDGVITVTDPHPSLDYARYRVVAQHTATSEVYYEDLPGIPMANPAIIIQWDETWNNFDYTGEDEMESPPWAGSMIRLPYNVDVSNNYKPDTSLIEYIGRRNPVSYYGTQRGETASWSTEIPKYDKETIYALRRLSAWMGDVYVREPSGVGYWAQITVSMNINHLETVVPITLDIKRVEGGV